MKKYIKKHPNIIIFSILCIISSIIYIRFILGHYATDTYNIINVGYATYIKNWYLIDGRIFSAIFLFIAKILNLSTQYVNAISIILAIIITNIAVIELLKWSKKYIVCEKTNSKIILILICYIIIWNFMYIENMYFLESCVMALSVLFYILSSKELVEKQKNYLLKSTIYTILGVISYQGTIGFIFLLTTLMTFIKNPKDYKSNICDIIKSGITAVIAVSIDMCIVKEFEKIIGITQTRLGEISNITINIKIIYLETINILKETCNLYPHYLLIILTSITLILLTINQIINKKEKTIILKSLIIIIVAILSSSVTFIISMTSFYTGRLRFCIGSMLGILVLYIAAKTNIFNLSKENIISRLIKIVFLIYFSTTIISNILNIYEHKQVNKLEKTECEEISKNIEKYEKETNNKIEKIQIILITDEPQKTYYTQSHVKNVLTYSGIRSNWSAVGCINFYTKKNLKETNIKIPKEELEEINKNTDLQICIGDTLYVKCYMY